MKFLLRSFLSLSVAAAIAILAGCSTPPQTAAEKKAAEEEYVTIMVTGSNIPLRIKKSDIAKGTVPQDVQAQLVDKDQFVKDQRPGHMNGN